MDVDESPENFMWLQIFFFFLERCFCDMMFKCLVDVLLVTIAFILYIVLSPF
jgi:hypothetical protein